MSSHSLTASCYLTAFVAVLFLYTLVHAQYTASIEEQVADQHGVVTGTVTYRQRIALPRQAVFQVRSKTAGKPGPSAQLENTHWKLIEVNGKAVSVPPKPREAHLLFKPNGNKLQGFGGCNRIIGGYERKDDSILFKAASPMMACVDGMETEQEFLKALEAATSFKLSGEELELYDNDRLLASFELYGSSRKDPKKYKVT